MFTTLEKVKQRRTRDVQSNTVLKNAAYEESEGYHNRYMLGYDDLHIKYTSPAMPVAQRYVQKEKNYDDEEIDWDAEEKREFWETVDQGIERANAQLEKVRARRDFLSIYATFVRAILISPYLEIFPMTDDEKKGIYGKSAFGSLQISLEVNNLRGKIYETAKTLIHEAFHIYGGCFKINDDPDKRLGDPELIYDPDLDTECRLEDINMIYNELVGKDKLKVRADAFAQYVMLYP